jgi:hypothetical protein
VGGADRGRRRTVVASAPVPLAMNTLMALSTRIEKAISVFSPDYWTAKRRFSRSPGDR